MSRAAVAEQGERAAAVSVQVPGEDGFLAAVEQALADAVAGLKVGERCVPSSRADQCPGAVGQVDSPQPPAYLLQVVRGPGQARDRDCDAAGDCVCLVAHGPVERVEQGVGGVAVSVADQQPGQVDDRFECEPGGPGIKGTRLQVGQGVAPAPLAGQVSGAAVRGEEGGLVEDRRCGGEVAAARSGTGQIADAAGPDGQRCAGRARDVMEGEIAGYKKVIAAMKAKMDAMPEAERREVGEASKILRRLRAGAAAPGPVALPMPVTRPAERTA